MFVIFDVNFSLEQTHNHKQIYCLNCGEKLFGEYCFKCGEKKLKREDQTVKKFFEQGIEVIVHYDSKVLKSIYLLVTKPGFLAVEYLRGRRVPYSKPSQLFIILNVIYFLSYIGFDTFTTPLYDHMNKTVYNSFASKMVNHKISNENITLKDYDEKFYTTISFQSRTLIFIMILLLALCFHLLYLRQGAYFYDNLVFSTYFFSFILLYLTTVLNILDFLFSMLFRYDFNFDTDFWSSDPLSFVIFTISMFIYLYIALKRVYKQPVLLTTVKTALSIAGLYITIEIYRLILFFTVFYTT